MSNTNKLLVRLTNFPLTQLVFCISVPYDLSLVPAHRENVNEPFGCTNSRSGLGR